MIYVKNVRALRAANGEYAKLRMGEGEHAPIIPLDHTVSRFIQEFLSNDPKHFGGVPARIHMGVKLLAHLENRANFFDVDGEEWFSLEDAHHTAVKLAAEQPYMAAQSTNDGGWGPAIMRLALPILSAIVEGQSEKPQPKKEVAQAAPSEGNNAS